MARNVPSFTDDKGYAIDAQGVYDLSGLDLRAVAGGRIDGASLIPKFGRNDSALAGSIVAGIDGKYTGFPTDGRADHVFVVSSNEKDEGVVTLIGLDEDWQTQVEQVKIAGREGGVSEKRFSRIHSANYQAGDMESYNLGTILGARKSQSNVIFFSMQAGRSQTNEMVFSVPDGHTAWLVRLESTVRYKTTNSNVSANAAIWFREHKKSPRLRRPFSVGSLNSYVEQFTGGMKMPAKSDLSAVVESVSRKPLDITVKMDILVLNNKTFDLSDD